MCPSPGPHESALRLFPYYCHKFGRFLFRTLGFSLCAGHDFGSISRFLHQPVLYPLQLPNSRPVFFYNDIRSFASIRCLHADHISLMTPDDFMMIYHPLIHPLPRSLILAATFNSTLLCTYHRKPQSGTWCGRAPMSALVGNDTARTDLVDRLRSNFLPIQPLQDHCFLISAASLLLHACCDWGAQQPDFVLSPDRLVPLCVTVHRTYQ